MVYSKSSGNKKLESLKILNNNNNNNNNNELEEKNKL